MKIIRFLSDGNKEYYGTLQQQNEAYLIKGDLYSNYEITNKTVPLRRLLAPIIPRDILCIGLNYLKHIQEQAAKKPDYPVLFLKTSNTVIGPDENILLPKAGPDNVDYEAELAVIIKRKAKNISPSEAKDIILGYTCANDISARDWQKHKQGRQWCRGKSFDTFCPLGPCIVTPEEIGDPSDLKISCKINDNIMQDSNTSDMIWNVYELISFLSKSHTLYPGTVILTGTPEGVGFTRNPPVFLKEGDRVSVHIENIGSLNNTVQFE